MSFPKFILHGTITGLIWLVLIIMAMLSLFSNSCKWAAERLAMAQESLEEV